MSKDFGWARFRFRFGDRLDALYEAEGPGFGQVEFAKRVAERSGKPFQQSRVSTLRNGRAEPSLEEVEMLALALDVSPGWLAFGKGPMLAEKGSPQKREKSSK